VHTGRGGCNHHEKKRVGYVVVAGVGLKVISLDRGKGQNSDLKKEKKNAKTDVGRDPDGKTDFWAFP